MNDARSRFLHFETGTYKLLGHDNATVWIRRVITDPERRGFTKDQIKQLEKYDIVIVDEPVFTIFNREI